MIRLFINTNTNVFISNQGPIKGKIITMIKVPLPIYLTKNKNPIVLMIKSFKLV